MKHTAWIVTAGSGPGARVGVPFLLPALQAVAKACCGEVRTIREEELDTALAGAEPGAALLLDASMPLICEEDCRALLSAVEQGAKSAAAREARNSLPRCVAVGAPETGEAVEVPLGEGALHRVETPEDLAQTLRLLRERKCAELMRAGVLLLDPERTYIDAGVRVGAGTVVYPNCTLTGGTMVGEGCTLLPNSRLHASTIGNGTTVESSVLIECEVGEKTTVGPFAYLRPGTRVGNGCRVGDFVELKNSVIGDETKISHLTYVGDSDLGKNINLGCGVVFVNYDGKRKHRSTVDDDAFIGCNVNLVSPVHVGKGAYVAAGSTVTDDVPAGALAIARERQVTKAGWADKRKQEGKL